MSVGVVRVGGGGGDTSVGVVRMGGGGGVGFDEESSFSGSGGRLPFTFWGRVPVSLGSGGGTCPLEGWNGSSFSGRGGACPRGGCSLSGRGGTCPLKGCLAGEDCSFLGRGGNGPREGCLCGEPSLPGRGGTACLLGESSLPGRGGTATLGCLLGDSFFSARATLGCLLGDSFFSARATLGCLLGDSFFSGRGGIAAFDLNGGASSYSTKGLRERFTVPEPEWCSGEMREGGSGGGSSLSGRGGGSLFSFTGRGGNSRCDAARTTDGNEFSSGMGMGARGCGPEPMEPWRRALLATDNGGGMALSATGSGCGGR